MSRSLSLTAALLVLLILGGCATGNMRSFPTAIPVKSLSGVIAEKDGTLWFRPCNDRLWWPVQDYTEEQELAGYYRQFILDSKAELYFELQGAVDPEQENSLLVKQLDTIGGTAATCNFQLRDVEFRAASSSPYWVADIGTKMTAVKSVNPAGSYHFFTLEESTDDPLVAHVYREKTKVAQPLQIKILSERCVDPENGTVLPFSAEMKFFGNIYKGCARKGHPSSEFLSGFYWHQPQDKPQILFKLSPNKRVQLVTRDSAGHAVTERGTWQSLESGKLIFSMLDSNEKEYLMLFRWEGAGRLILQAGSEHYTSAGAAFRLWRPSGLSGGTLLEDQVVKVQESSTREPAVTESAATVIDKAELFSETVLPANIDDELLNEIIVTD
ncbi:hypothetical protein [Amphritea japonica]|nr:hypothetical protein [Amphritea japonica]